MRAYVASYVEKHLASIQLVANVTASSPVIGTHDGSFHCDEAMACGLLRHTVPFGGASILRTRDPEVLNQCNIVVDVGGVYDFAKLRLDHHQNEFQDSMRIGNKTYSTRLSSAGLVYRHFGVDIIQRFGDYCYKDAGVLQQPLSENHIQLVYDRVYSGFVEHVDGIDNGVESFSLQHVEGGKQEGGVVLKRNYNVSTTLSSRVGALYPRWNEVQSKEKENAAFKQAVLLATGEFFTALDFYCCSWLPARDVVERAFQDRCKVHSSGCIMILQQGGCPWKEHLFDLEEGEAQSGNVRDLSRREGAGECKGYPRTAKALHFASRCHGKALEMLN